MTRETAVSSNSTEHGTTDLGKTVVIDPPPPEPQPSIPPTSKNSPSTSTLPRIFQKVRAKSASHGQSSGRQPRPAEGGPVVPEDLAEVIAEDITPEDQTLPSYATRSATRVLQRQLRNTI